MKKLNVVFGSKKANRSVEVDLMTLPEASIMAVAAYGARRFINDKLGGSEIDAKEAGKMFDDIMAQLQKGWEGRQAGVDPVEVKALGIARDQVKAAIQAKGLALKDVGKEKIAELAKAQFDKAPDEYRKTAAEQIEAERKARDKAASAVDLGDLGL